MGRTCAVLLVLAATLLTSKAASDTCSSSGKAQYALLAAFDGPLSIRLKFLVLMHMQSWRSIPKFFFRRIAKAVEGERRADKFKLS